MKPRSVNTLGNLPDERFFEQVSEGLLLIWDHVYQLNESAKLLNSSGQVRGANALQMIADEEAAKYLILLDAVRCPRREQRARDRQLRRFQDHLAKGIYAKVCEMRPATFGELKSLIDSMRPSLYLDGPNDVDWVFRNQVLAEREEKLYVDYVLTDDGAMWYSPSRFDDLPPYFPQELGSDAVGLAGFMTKAGFHKPSGLAIIAGRWRDLEMTDETHWQVIAENNARTVEDVTKVMSSEDAVLNEIEKRYIVERWTYPLYGVELQAMQVEETTLRQEQARWLANQGF